LKLHQLLFFFVTLSSRLVMLTESLYIWTKARGFKTIRNVKGPMDEIIAKISPITIEDRSAPSPPQTSIPEQDAPSTNIGRSQLRFIRQPY
jgi:hypothetical protein